MIGVDYVIIDTVLCEFQIVHLQFGIKTGHGVPISPHPVIANLTQVKCGNLVVKNPVIF